MSNGFHSGTWISKKSDGRQMLRLAGEISCLTSKAAVFKRCWQCCLAQCREDETLVDLS